MPGSWPQPELPALTDENCRLTSPFSRSYNCIGWAAGDASRWWWPDPLGIYYWPSAPVLRAAGIDAFIQAYATLGYFICPDGQSEPLPEKIAIYGLDVNGSVVPTHAARQLASGDWTSKLGHFEDITHAQVEDLFGPAYGRARVFMQRARR